MCDSSMASYLEGMFHPKSKQKKGINRTCQSATFLGQKLLATKKTTPNSTQKIKTLLPQQTRFFSPQTKSNLYFNPHFRYLTWIRLRCLEKIQSYSPHGGAFNFDLSHEIESVNKSTIQKFETTLFHHNLPW